MLKLDLEKVEEPEIKLPTLLDHRKGKRVPEKAWSMGFLDGSVVKKPPDNAGDVVSIPGLGRPPGGGNATHSSSLAWRIPWTEEPGGLSTTESKRVRHD